MLVANQIDLKMPKQQRSLKSCKTCKVSKPVSKEKELIPTNGTLLAIRQMKEGNLRSFDTVKEMMNEIG